jgi:LPXTG-motif cell wall-anchored protein
MRKAIIITVGLMALLLPGVASAQDSTVEFAITVPEGVQVIEDVPGYRESFTYDVPAEAIGLTCTAVDVSDNNKSVHLGNNIELTSASGSVVLEDVERGPGVTTVGTGSIVLGSTVTATIVLSPEPNWFDRSIFSGQHTVTITCDVPPPTTTLPPPETDPVCEPALFKIEGSQLTDSTVNGVTFVFNGLDSVTVTYDPAVVNVTAVSVKGGSEQNGGGYATYVGGPYVDLTAPLNPQSGKVFSISHIIVCGEEAPPVTTTTEPPTTTTEPPEITTTTEVPPETTTTSPPVETTTTTNPPVETTTTTETPEDPTTTVVDDSPDELPRTGPEDLAWFALAGAALLMSGFGALAFSRKRNNIG